MNLNKFLMLSAAFITCSLIGQAQRTVMSVGAVTALTIKSGTVFSADSLVLTPSADLTLASNTIQVSGVAVPTNPHATISRVYYLNSPVNFTGTMEVYYQPSELNGNTEATLQLTDSTVSNTWLSEAASTVNTLSHFVQLITANHSFNAASASGVVIPLPLELISFVGAWNSNGVGLEWVVDQSDEMVNYAVESSSDGARWKEIGQVAGVPGNGLFTFNFEDIAPPSNSMYYRIRIIQVSGQFTYSYIVQVNKGANNNDIRLIVNNNTLSVYFMGTQPSGMRLVNTLGMIVYTDATSRSEYNVTGLFPGVYFLQFRINGQWGVREFLVQ